MRLVEQPPQIVRDQVPTFPQNKSLIVWLHGYTYTLQAYFHCLEYFHQTGLSSTAAAVYAAVRLGQSLVQRHFHCDSGSTMLCLDATIMTNLGRTILQDAIATPTGYQRMPKSLEMEIKCSSSHQINSRVSEKNALIIYIYIYIYYIIYIIYYIIYIYISYTSYIKNHMPTKIPCLWKIMIAFLFPIEISHCHFGLPEHFMLVADSLFKSSMKINESPQKCGYHPKLGIHHVGDFSPLRNGSINPRSAPHSALG